jgi:hypothetical protein
MPCGRDTAESIEIMPNAAKMVFTLCAHAKARSHCLLSRHGTERGLPTEAALRTAPGSAPGS